MTDEIPPPTENPNSEAEAPKEPHKSSFSLSGGDKKKHEMDPELVSLKEAFKGALSGMKSFEDKLLNLDKKVQVMENNLLIVKKRLNLESKTLNSRVLDTDKEIDLIKKSILEVVADLKNFSRVEEVATIRKYLDLWEPLEFVTRNEINQIVDEKLNQ